MAAMGLADGLAQAQGAQPPQEDAGVVARADKALEGLLKRQITASSSPYRGSYPDDDGLHHVGSASGIIELGTAALVCPQSRWHRSGELRHRIGLALGFLERGQSPDGNIDLIISNFNSPPDTGFVVHNVATAAYIARQYEAKEVFSSLAPFLKKAAEGMAKGGVHTPNHRWVVCAALAEIHALLPDERWVRRIDQWLAEGIDIDADGQYNERSVLVYNVVTNRALIVMAEKLGRPQLLEPVRRNLESMLYLLHADGEVVTEISRRQDVNTTGDMGRYWFALQYMALKDGNGRFARLARQFSPEHASLAALLEYPELNRTLPADAPLPDTFQVEWKDVGIARVRRGLTSATIVLNGNSRIFTLRHGDAVLNAVRFASAFFGKAQFIPEKWERQGEAYVLTQRLQAPYWQPLDRRVAPEEWGASRAERRQTEICRLEQSATIRERGRGFDLRLRAHGTDGVPLAVEINLKQGGKWTGATPIEKRPDCWLFAGQKATYELGRHRFTFSPGVAAHRYVQVRGAQPKLEGPSLYLTAYTPFDHTLRIEWS
jgi:hypothetical protein